jgi:adenylosuccinate synthase
VDVFVRYQGGANAGHTVIANGKKIIFKLLPSGMLYPGKLCVIGNGVVLDPEQLLKELKELGDQGQDRARLVISPHAHVVMPYHKVLDKAQETFRGKGRMIGTTGRGIGPCYVDKYARNGLRVEDLLDECRLREKISVILEEKNRLLTKLYGENPLPLNEIYEPAREWGKALLHYVEDTTALLYDAADEGKSILLEGAQGTLLDIDHGTYPYVTSSSTTTAGGFTGTGLPLTSVTRVIGVVKAYTTRVGEGPMPTEDKGDIGNRLREKGGEFGSVTGRPRRCGWLDLTALRYAMRVNGCGTIALTKLDVLSGLSEIKVCTAYELNGTKTERFVGDPVALEECRPVYETLPGWEEDLSGCTEFGALPEAARKYIRYIEERTGVPVSLIGVGADRNQTINRGF